MPNLNPFERPPRSPLMRPPPLVRDPPAPPPPEHNLDHFFKGVCICSCKACTEHVVVADGKSKRGGLNGTRCICPDCPKDLCGAKFPVTG